jgi:type-F conjugative transfer system secretin TraK
VSVKGIKGTYLLVKDEKQGSIYIKPTSYFSKKPFDIFITTESGLTYDLFLMPKQIPSETIWIKPLNSSNKKAKRWEVNSSYSDKLVELIKEMQSESHPEGYAVIPVDGKVKKINGLKVQLLKVYRGFHLQGEVWCVMNDTRKPIKINLNDFKYNGLLALSMEDDYLKIGEEVYLYKVVSHG